MIDVEQPINEYRGSAIDTFAHCRKKYQYEYVEKIEAAKRQKPLYFGTVMHKYLETLYSTRNQTTGYVAGLDLILNTDLSNEDPVWVQDTTFLYMDLSSNYGEYWNLCDINRNTIATEMKFRVHLGGDDWFVGTIDHLFEDANTGHVWLEDHKTVKSITQYIQNIEYSRQTPRYFKALRMLASGNGEVMIDKKWTPVTQHFPSVHGIIFNLISKTVPHPPKLLASGKGLSVDKAQHTTLALYQAALVQHGFATMVHDDIVVDEKYAEILALLASQETEQGNRYFRRVPILKSVEQMDFAMNEMRDIIYEIDLATVTDRFYRNSGRHCGWCQYNAICSAEAAGDNVEMILDTMYRPKSENPYAEDDEIDAEADGV